jgi:hypothetical protein
VTELYSISEVTSRTNSDRDASTVFSPSTNKIRREYEDSSSVCSRNCSRLMRFGSPPVFMIYDNQEIFDNGIAVFIIPDDSNHSSCTNLDKTTDYRCELWQRSFSSVRDLPDHIKPWFTSQQWNRGLVLELEPEKWEQHLFDWAWRKKANAGINSTEK